MSQVMLSAYAGGLELLGQRRGAPRGALDGGAHRGVLQPLRRLAFLVGERAAGAGGCFKLQVSEFERHARIVAPLSTRVHAVGGGIQGCMAARRLRAAFSACSGSPDGRVSADGSRLDAKSP